ncbi:AMP-binding protein [Amnimonas aquatica]|uniref:Long-chain-fatty-acid--CoA ligase n=1 Tax=Amnimonas aquatica TaxID=2094561 RepID=A0A2P6AS58_9GAMM|nr:AMP-binding protein [Amnimonas aquatica]PQA40627.1 long-chain fatty acid--CoA ligase [Amnimonas aquatica]
MQADFWKDKYPENVPYQIDTAEYASVLDVFHTACGRYVDAPAFSNMGHTLTYGELHRLSAAFASYIQNHTTLKPGDRIAVQMPNLLQYPVVVFGAMRAGLIVVNTNPLYTEREMLHQFNDAGVKALVALANFGNLVQAVLPKTGIEYLFLTEVGDILPVPKRWLVNTVVRHVKKMVPEFSLPQAIPLTRALSQGRRRSPVEHQAQPGDVAVLQYTGGTTGVAKGAMLTHANLAANLLQIRAVLTSSFEPGKETMIAPLPLYHIFAFTVCCLGMMELGGHTVLITNPRDIPAFVKELGQWRFTAIAGLNTLFVALLNSPDFRKLDFSSLKLTVAGGMAMQLKPAEEWEKLTGCQVCEGFGMTETSPVVSLNPLKAIQLGTIGMPVPSTELKVVDENGEELPVGEAGELCVRGPQVMKGYWQRPEATAETIDADGWLKTGDVAVIQPDGYLRIVDRKKDMILVSGFNVYPNEIEDVAAGHPGVLESAAVGVPDEKSGEVVKLFVVKKDPALTEEALMAHLRANLTGYKVPRFIVFRPDLPKTNVGKILRRELRDA